MNLKRKLGRLAATIGASAMLALTVGSPGMATTTRPAAVDEWPTVVYMAQGQDTVEMRELNNSDGHHKGYVADLDL